VAHTQEFAKPAAQTQHLYTLVNSVC